MTDRPALATKDATASLENPFTPHSPAPPSIFVGRAREQDLLFGHITAQQRGNVAISGPLGSGKTSLLSRIADPDVGLRYGTTPPDYVVVYVDVQSVTPFTGRRFWRRVAHLIRRMPDVDLEAPIEMLLARDELDIIDIEEFLDAIADRGSALVLLLDEFEWALHADSASGVAESRTFLAQLASLARRSPRVLSLVVATERPLAEAMRVVEAWRGSPFPTIFTSLALQPLAPADAADLLDAARAAGLDVTEEEAELALSLASGRPAVLQAAAFALFHGKRKGLTEDALRDAVRQAARGSADALAATEARDAEPSGARRPAAVPPGLWIDGRSGEVFVDGRRIDALTALEYNLLRLLYDHPGRLCSKDDIIRKVWGEESMAEIDDSRVEKLVSRLRRKVEPMPGRPQYIRTVRGRGYRFVPVSN